MGFFNKIMLFDIPRSMDDLYKPSAKKFTFSAVVNKEIVEQRAADVAELTDRTVSNVIEDALIDQLLAHDDHARHYVNGVLFGKKQLIGSNEWRPYTIKDALGDIFSSVSAGINWEPKYKNTRPLVDFANDLISAHDPMLKKNKRSNYPDELDELEYSFDSLCSVLQAQAKNGRVVGLDSEARRARESIYPRIIKAKTRPAEIMQLILLNWNVIENSTHTFRVLHHLFSACEPWEDTAAERSRFQNVCEIVMSEWTREEEEKELRIKREKIDLQLLSYDIAGGDCVRAPSRWCVLNQEIATNAHYAGVIEIKNGARYDSPHFLFFLTDHEVKDMNEVEQEELIERATKLWEGMKQVKADEVELKYGSDGGISNLAEFSAAPRIGFFPIFNRGEYPLEQPPFGAEIIRNGSPLCEDGGAS